MNAPSPRPPYRAPRPARPTPLRYLLVCLATLGLGATMAADNLGVMAVISNTPQIALGLPIGRARAMAMFALQQAQAHAPFTRVAFFAAHANALSPLGEPAFTGAGLAATNPAQAHALLDHAHRLSRRDPFLLALLYQRAHAEHDYATQVTVLDELSRLRIETLAIDQTMAGDLADPAARAPLAKLMAGRPFWRERFLGNVADDLPARPALAALVEDLRHSPAPLSRDEMLPLLFALLNGPHADPALAYRLWRGPEGSPPAGWPWPAAPATGPALPFEWTLGAGAEITGGEGNRHLAFDTRQSGPGTIATRSLPLEAGRYRLALLTDTAGLSVAITCKDQTQRIAAGGEITIAGDCGLVRVQVQALAGAGTLRNLMLQRL